MQVQNIILYVIIYVVYGKRKKKQQHIFPKRDFMNCRSHMIFHVTGLERLIFENHLLIFFMCSPESGVLH